MTVARNIFSEPQGYVVLVNRRTLGGVFYGGSYQKLADARQARNKLEALLPKSRPGRQASGLPRRTMKDLHAERLAKGMCAYEKHKPGVHGCQSCYDFRKHKQSTGKDT